MIPDLAPLKRSFFDRNAALVAPDLAGCLLVRREGKRVRMARIVETEAYLGEHDLACHARAGRTARTEPMYGEPGHAYVYFVYGIHHMLNVVCGPGGAPNAVLIRAAAPLDESRAALLGLAARDLAPLAHSGVGPGNLCRALEIDLQLNRADLCDADSPLWIAPRIGPPPDLVASPRVGVDYAGEWAKEPLRFSEQNEKHVSKPRPARPSAIVVHPRPGDRPTARRGKSTLPRAR